MKTTLAFVLLVAVNAISAQDSCSSLGCVDYDIALSCQCNRLCEGYGNCCSDYYGLCDTCEAFGGCLDYDNRHSCQCNVDCSSFGNCCSDYESFCGSGAPDNCVGRCGTSPDATKTCQCDADCSTYGDCCSDFTSTCSGTTTTTTTSSTTGATTTTTTQAPTGDTCVGRCNAALDSSKSCQCNTACNTYGDCCPDYSETCGGSGGGGGLDFNVYASDLWARDVNRIDSSSYTVNIQTELSSSSNNVDQAPSKLFSYFDEATIYNTGTFVQFKTLCDNYEPNQGVTEDRDSNQDDLNEQTAYLDAIMATSLMQHAVTKLAEVGLVADAADFRSKLITAFFDLYQRTASDDSSGFEHCFCGEWKSSTQVNGFHNWIQFYELEKQGALDYYGNFGMSQPDHLGVQFYWSGRKKPLTSIMLGVSTEFELAIYMACFLENPGSQTSFTITDGANSWPIKVQTYTQNTVHVGSAYFIS
ncbi:uridylate-specific endoribonuclease B-like [Apostichopus japonicus]|uniref:uridylate-specific endoribonuclease B-like n=1 Tax=Stichopus japonicus TaxID=307972 RepID=UPI003AB788A8